MAKPLAQLLLSGKMVAELSVYFVGVTLFGLMVGSASEPVESVRRTGVTGR